VAWWWWFVEVLATQAAKQGGLQKKENLSTALRAAGPHDDARDAPDRGGSLRHHRRDWIGSLCDSSQQDGARRMDQKALEPVVWTGCHERAEC